MSTIIFDDYLVISRLCSDIRRIYISAEFYYKKFKVIREELKSQVLESDDYKGLCEREKYFIEGYLSAEDHRFKVDKLLWDNGVYVYRNDQTKICF